MTENKTYKNVISDLKSDDLFNYKADGEIESESSKQNYLIMVTENIRLNNKAIQRNSFVLILSLTIYFLIINGIINELNIFSVRINEKAILLNGISVLFSYLYMVNIIRWYSNIDLRFKFDELARGLYKIGVTSNTLKMLSPFSIMLHSLDYQTEKKELRSWMKWPGTILQGIVLFGPILIEVYLIYNIFRLNTFNAIPIICGVLTILITINTIIYATRSR